jgi:surfeit locus 1 family protein
MFMAIFISLAIWQAHRAFVKQELLTSLTQHETSVTTLIPEVVTPEHQYQSIRIQGTFDNEHLFFLDNRWYGNLPGYEVLQVFKPAKGLPVLVNRGFLSHHGNRLIWPEISLFTGQIILEGRLNHPAPGFQLSNLDDTPNGWPKLIQSVDFNAISKKLGYPVAPYVVMIAENSPYGYPSAWQPSRLSPARHWGYSVQWGLLAVMVFIATVITMRK